jgi:predicted short-subunit dehydrogenase-like oxidoreductase (DUF2520 family)
MARSRTKRSRASITIVGSGNVAHALAPALARAGYKIDAIFSRSGAPSLQRARALGRRVKAGVGHIGRIRIQSRVTWLCVSDDAIPDVAKTIAADDWKGKFVFHSSGALSSGELAQLKRRGARVASVHPMMTFVAGVQPELRGVPFGVEGDPAAVRIARKIVRDLGGQAFAIRKRSKPLYHATGSFSSPMIIATLATAERVAAAAGIPRNQAAKVMAPILKRTLDNYLRRGTNAAFSGPIKRADVSTIRKHLDALAHVPGAREVYVALTRSALKSIAVRDRKAVERVLRSF